MLIDLIMEDDTIACAALLFWGWHYFSPMIGQFFS